EPFAKTWNRRQRGEGPQPGQLAAEVIDHLLDQRITERHTAEAFLAVGNRVKDRTTGGRGIGNERIGIEQRLHLRDQAERQRDLDENERLVWERGMQERVAAPVGLQPPAEIVPALNLVNRLVANQALQ